MQEQVLNKVAIIRHGDHRRGILTTEGNTNLERLGVELKNIIGEEEAVCLLSSNALAALNSSSILGRMLSVEVSRQELLFSKNESDMNLEAAYYLIHGVANNGLVIVVTHFEYADNLPSFLGRHDLGTEFGNNEMRRGTGVLLDYPSKTLRKL